jgi:cytochrome c oxidase assembly factor CtaG
VLGVGLLYMRGWLRLPKQNRRTAAARLASFGLGWLLLVVALFSPLFALRTELLLARTIQQILLGLLAAPLFWLGAPAQTIRWGLPVGLRRRMTALLGRERNVGRVVYTATRPGAVWLMTLGSFLIWADPAFVQWSVASELIYSISLWFFFFVYLLFWMHVVKSGPRLHKALHPGIGFLYVLIGGEVPNMATGVTLAFRETLTYPIYAGGSTTVNLAPLMDQTLSGCTIWVVGSVIYISVCLGILGRVFRNEDAPLPLPISWHATQRTIAPGLEHRVSPRKP